MISDEKKLEMIESSFMATYGKGGNYEQIQTLSHKWSKGDLEKCLFAHGYLAALRQLEPVVDAAQAPFDEGVMSWDGRHGVRLMGALKAAGLEE